MATNYVCMIKKGVEPSKYGFVYKYGEWTYWIKTRRITINKKNQLQFNQITVDVLRVFSEMVKDDVVYFIPKEDAKFHHLVLSNEEYKVIMEMRKK